MARTKTSGHSQRGQFYGYSVLLERSGYGTRFHEDAQYSNEHTLRAFQDNLMNGEAQVVLVAADASAFGLAATGVWTMTGTGLKKVLRKAFFQREEEVIIMRSVNSR